MKKGIILILIMVVFGLNLFSQNNTKATWGPTYKMPSKLGTRIVCEDATGFYIIRSQRRASKGIILDKFDKKMNQKYSEELIIPKKDKNEMLFEDVVYINKQLVLLVSYFDRKNKKNYYFAYPIDDKGKVGSKFKLLDENTTEKSRDGANYDFVMSKDTTKMLLYYNPPFDKKADEKFHYKVFDQSFNLIWEKEVELPYKDKLVAINDYIIDNDANVFMLLTISPDRKKGEKETKVEQAKKFMVLSYKHKTNKFDQYEVKLKNKWIESIDYDYNPSLNQLVLGGFYSDDFKIGTVNGIFYMKLDINSGEVKVSSMKPFDKDFMTDMVGEKKAEKGKGIGNFVVRQFFAKKDGGAYIVAEQYYVVVHTYTNPKTGATTTTYTYYYNDIIVASINPKGEIDWLKKITKKSADKSGGYYLSYAISHNKEKDDLNIVFNDNPKNIELYKKNPNKLAMVGNVKKAVATWVSINRDGNIKRLPLFTAKELDKIILQPRVNLRSENDITVYGIRGKEYKFGKISFN